MSLALARSRWFQTGVMPASIVGMAAGLPAPELASEDSTSMVRDYLRQWIADANPAGRFHAQTRWLQWVPPSLWVRTLFALGYDGLIYINDGVAFGHVYFQRHGSSMHVFSAAVTEPLRGKGYSIPMLLDSVAYAHTMPGISGVKVGTGQNNRRLFDCLTTYGDQLGWQVRPDRWVEFGGSRGPQTQGNSLAAELTR